ncbi:HpcH/HpaI aldolase/citrate lyase family protein [Crystallibacter degradans]|uniref:HpcH/HpaI aldolase/citrate lyase family protein n=1 Tax=Crystallibacter degradans TaxID=2726743 RepID=UPI0014750C32|nr:CoA ester lyase [Arthrobacter sp. SF27]NMR31617.1 CoA ester lyase [Arthrobacter sp. SF27]
MSPVQTAPAGTVQVSTGQAVTAAATVRGAVTALFVPGDRPERFAKAAASGADVVIIDLEDAVAAADKACARQEAVAALTAFGAKGSQGVRALVRVNAQDTAEYDDDIQALLALASQPGHGLLGVMLPKAEDPEQVAELAAKLPVPLVALVESALGLVNAVELARVPGVERLAFGAIDFALDIDADGSDRVLDHARAQLVVASRAAGIAPPLDSPSTDIRDTAAVAASAKLGRGFGFGGKLCIHPAQLTAVSAAFTPSPEEIAWARKILATDGGAVQMDGQMVDRPVIDRARRIIERTGTEPTGQD